MQMPRLAAGEEGTHAPKNKNHSSPPAADRIWHSHSFNVGTAGAKIFTGPAAEEFGYQVQQATNHKGKWYEITDNARHRRLKRTIWNSVRQTCLQSRGLVAPVTSILDRLLKLTVQTLSRSLISLRTFWDVPRAFFPPQNSPARPVANGCCTFVSAAFGASEASKNCPPTAGSPEYRKGA